MAGDIVKCIGRQVKLFRERAGLTQAQLGEAIGYSEEQVSSVEQGRRVPQPEFLDAADEALEAFGVLRAAKEEVANVQLPAFFRGAARLEAQATEFHAYDSQVVNGLLQTQEYARVIYRMRRPVLDEKTVEQRVSARLARQELFAHRPAPAMSFVTEETVLRRPLGGEEVLRGELEHLLSIGQMRNVELQVMPTNRRDHAGLGGPFALLERKGRQLVAYSEVQGRGTLVTDRKAVRELEQRYGIIRAQALTPQESLDFIEKLRGET
ncbi:helix-turn-helix domain-containing protein [Streptomyces rapamycinicus]|uniref:helix-turn-helix domain-containing protein n=1 Tax=Streptomyces rapamycinicus TaxID=1226757 RepID=UPI0020CA0E11|nr:helix-turn-helix transcriptional regulator [Streptomyces rapamycinicus]UTP34595.1 helix-turn-helix domain-containing protein [Streptomyces rapamycinicus NRRL 5491]